MSKIILLAGGTGTRLGSITQHIPKPMVNIGGRPLLWHIMKTYAQYGHNDFVIALGYRGDIIKNYFLNFRTQNNDFTVNLKDQSVNFHQMNDTNPDWKVSLVDTGESSLKGSRIKRLEQHIDGTTMMTYGDGLSNININKLLAFHKSHGKILTISGVNPPSRFGEMILDEDKLLNFEEKPQTSTGFINGGYMVFEPELLQYLSTDTNCDLEYGAIRELALLDEVRVFRHNGLWACVDHERDLEYMNSLWLKDEAFWIL